MDYLEMFASYAILLGVILMGPYVAPLILTKLDKWKEEESRPATNHS